MSHKISNKLFKKVAVIALISLVFVLPSIVMATLMFKNRIWGLWWESLVLLMAGLILARLICNNMIWELRRLLAFKKAWSKYVNNCSFDVLRELSNKVSKCFTKDNPGFAEIKQLHKMLVVMLELGYNVTTLEVNLQASLNQPVGIDFTRLDDNQLKFFDLKKPEIWFDLCINHVSTRYINGR